tara:strand:- start:12956 stop:13717 length:762 start_codon:yes stop_codon:yes gene_type:complete
MLADTDTQTLLEETNDEPKCELAAPAFGADELWSRKQAAEFLTRSESAVRRLENRGKLQPVRRDGRIFLRRVEVVELLTEFGDTRTGSVTKNSSGEIAARVFTLFEKGYNISRVVRDLRLPPKEVRTLYKEWMDEARLTRLALPLFQSKYSIAQVASKLGQSLATITDFYKQWQAGLTLQSGQRSSTLANLQREDQIDRLRRQEEERDEARDVAWLTRQTLRAAKDVGVGDDECADDENPCATASDQSSDDDK